MSYWLFRTNSAHYRAHDALVDLGRLSWNVWRRSKPYGPISIGDKACLLETGPSGGVYGIVEVVEAAEDREMPPEELEYISDVGQFKSIDHRVIVAPITHLSLLLPTSQIKNDAVFSTLPVFAEAGFPKPASIFPLNEELYNEVLAVFSKSRLSRPQGKSNSEDIPTDDHRQFADRRIPVRSGQPAFRRMILDAYRHRCAITNCDVRTALEASHIVNYAGLRSDRIDNGILLRIDLHRLFDSHLISIDPDSWKVRISPAIAHSAYAKWEGHPFRTPEQQNKMPSAKELKKHLSRTIGR
ncbi:MAG: HNH endonuclease [Parvibaculum sp.]|uniref:HNH endonuclease n=1 Tax=Parvibaculum sp. TaxID=2024848 RepID=UPI00349FFA7E